MKHKILTAVLAVTLLVGCTDRREGTPSVPSQSTPTQAVVTPESLGREEQTTLAGDTFATLYIGKGYSIYIPDEDWTLELDSEEGVYHQTWESDREQDAELTVYHYEDVSFMVARDRFLKDCGYVFGDGLGGEMGDPLYGTDDDGDVCEFVVVEGSRGVTYVVAWEYPAGTEETCGTLLAAMAETFMLAE